MVITKDMHRDYCKFMNALMDLVYEVLFQERLSSILPEIKSMLQSSPERRVEDWFLSEDNTLIRVYGFTHQPYVLPAFLILRVFSLELIRKRFTVENEYFMRFKKQEDIKFPWAVCPFNIKNKLALPKVKIFLRERGFAMEAMIDYDPHHIISNKRKENKRKPFKQVEVVGWQ